MVEQFKKIYGESLFIRMMENVYGDANDDDISVTIEHSDVNGLNKSGTVHICNDEVDITVEFTDGNWAGTQILKIK